MKNILAVFTCTIVSFAISQPCLFGQTTNSTPMVPSSATSSTASGSIEKQSKALADKIAEAGKHGVGMAGYQTALRNIEDKIRTGAPNQEVEPLIKKLSDSLNEQLDRVEKTKAQAAAKSANKPQSIGQKLPPGNHQASNSKQDVASKRLDDIVARRSALIEQYKEGKITQQQMDREICKDGLPLMRVVCKNKAEAERFARRQMMLGRSVRFVRN